MLVIIFNDQCAYAGTRALFHQSINILDEILQAVGCKLLVLIIPRA